MDTSTRRARAMDYTSDRNRNSMQGGTSRRRRPENQTEAMIHDLQDREKSLNAVFLSSGAISASVVYRIMYNLWNIPTIPQPFLYAVIRSYFSQRTTSSKTSPQAPRPSISPSSLYDPPVSFDSSFSPVLRVNVYWFTTLVFSVSAVALAILGKQVVRGHRDKLQATLRRQPKGARIPTISQESVLLAAAIDAMYRLFQVALVLVLLAHVDAIVISVGVDILIPIVVFGLLYVFGVIGPAVFQ